MIYNIITHNRILVIMSDRRYKKVIYIEGHTLDGDVLVPLVKEQEVMITGTKRFHNCLYLILGVNKLQRVLMDWISEEMDDRNMIRNDIHTREMFSNFLKEISVEGQKVSYGDQSIANAFHGLSKSGLLIRHTKSVYQVNPKYYWRGGDKERIEIIMLNLQFNSKETNFKVLDAGKYTVTKKDNKDWGKQLKTQ